MKILMAEALLVLCLIWPALSQEAAANRIQHGRYLAQEGDNSNPKPISETTSPSPSPHEAAAEPKSGGNDEVDNSKVTCDMNFGQCHDDVQNITACLLPNAVSTGLFLLVQNNGENSLKLNATLLPVNSTLDIEDIMGHNVKKIIVSSDASSSASSITAIVLHSANWTCIIERRVRLPPSFSSYIANVKPINAVYLLFGTVLVIGMLWGCWKLGKDVRHLSGVPYQELEMGQQENGASVNAEAVDSWDQSWDDDDDDWDEEMAVKSTGGGNGQVNGNSSKPVDSNGWGSGWDD